MHDTKPPKVQPLSETLARTLPPGEYQDKKQGALYFYVSPKGTRSYGFYKWSTPKGQPVRRTIGKWPETKTEDARKQADAWAVLVGKGEDISKKSEAKPNPEPVTVEPTLGDIVKLYTKEARQKGHASWYWVERIVAGNKQFEGSYPDWLDRPLSSITRSELDERHRRIAFGEPSIPKRGPEAANASLKAMRALFAFAIKKEIYKGLNVAKLVDKEKSSSRERVLSTAEYTAIIGALDDLQFLPYVKPYFRLLMLTGARRSNMAAARWEDIDLDQGVWTVTAGESKNRREMRIHLRAEAVELFRAIKKKSTSPWVFPSPNHAASGHIEEVWPVWKQILKVAGVKDDITIHDLRRTFGSRLLNEDTPMEVVAKLLGHRNAATTAKHYAFLEDQTLVKHLNRVKG